MTAENAAPVTQPLPNALAAVEQDIARACREARRERASVTLIAVSKTFDAEAILPVIAAGQRVFGENRVQEAKAKWPALTSAHPGLALHLIGPLQSNKAKEAVALFDAIHSVDRPSICEALAKEIGRQQRTPDLFVQLNTGEEPQKAGVAPAEADAFIAACRDKYGLKISGLMCIPPVDDAPAPHFALTAKIAARNGLKNHPITILVSLPSRFSSRSIAPFVIDTHPAVGEKSVRARCRNTALPRPAMRGLVLWSVSMMKS
jgi:pyridoxal phosphate enzyme (YggS family)